LTSTFSQDAFGASPFDNDADESSSPFDTIPSNTAQQPSAPSGSFDDTFPIPPPASTSVTQHTSQPSFSSSSSVSQYANPPGIVLGAPTKAFEVDNALLPSNPTPINTTNLPSHQPTASFSSAGEGAKSPAIANFDDDFDSDFDVVPSANGSSAPPPPQASSPNVSQHQPKQASSGGDDFGFDAFDNDFDAVPTGNPSSSLPAPSQQQQSSTLSAFPPSTSNDPYKVDPSFADFDSAFGPTATSTSSSSRPAPPTNNFSFDDAFDAPSSFFAPHGSPPGPPPGQSAAPTSPPRQSEPQQQYAPPAGPPPPSFAASTAAAPPPTPERPALPSRKTEADSDDIPDVKKLVGMGFSRSQALNALEVSSLPSFLSGKLL
jgi:epidermal growth factor receptor substrate 15